MPQIRHSPCAPVFSKIVGQPCFDELLPAVYQASLSHARSLGQGGKSISHTPWEAVTFVAVSAIVLVAYMAILGYLATRALSQIPAGNAIGNSSSLLDTRIVYEARKGPLRQPVTSAELTEVTDDLFDV